MAADPTTGASGLVLAVVLGIPGLMADQKKPGLGLQDPDHLHLAVVDLASAWVVHTGRTEEHLASLVHP